VDAIMTRVITRAHVPPYRIPPLPGYTPTVGRFVAMLS